MKGYLWRNYEQFEKNWSCPEILDGYRKSLLTSQSSFDFVSRAERRLLPQMFPEAPTRNPAKRKRGETDSGAGLHAGRARSVPRSGWGAARWLGHPAIAGSGPAARWWTREKIIHEAADYRHVALISSLPSARHNDLISPGWFIFFFFPLTSCRLTAWFQTFRART